jgi:predicted secreted hydrolase
MLPRRRWLLHLGALGLGAALPPSALSTTATTATQPFASADPRYRLRFPRDHGSHPDFRIEWWYVTGWLERQSAAALGFQITFFRARPQAMPDNPSRFHPRHIIIAHAALSDPAHGRLRHAQRAARAVFDLAGAAEDDTRVWLGNWQLRREGSVYHAAIDDAALALDLELRPTQALLLQGRDGYSRKGADAGAASHYYSQPQLQVGGRCRAGGHLETVTGRAWLDHEWSSAYLPRGASGWDWVGLNFDDGSALMAFRMRGQADNAVLWAAATWRDAGGRTVTIDAQAIRFTPLRHWQSPRTALRYPVAFRLNAGALDLELQPLMDDQENDTRRTTGAIYWEGAVTVLQEGRRIGRGYLELTGYGEPLRI